jgi:microcystin-dependent protein
VAETSTPNYGWTMPDPGASANTWGNTLNATTQKIDNQVFQNQQGLVPIGMGGMWFTPTPPPNFLLLDGTSYSTAAPYDKLFAIYQYKFGGSGANFNVPNLTQKFPLGAGTTNAVGVTGGEATHVLTAAELAAHTHPATQAAHTHTATQAAHSHSASQDAHTHNASQDAHSHTLQSALGSGSGLTNGGASFSLGTITTSTAQPAVHIDTQQPAVHIDTQQPAITVVAQQPAITVAANTGGGAAHNNMPPFIAVYFAVRYQ